MPNNAICTPSSVLYAKYRNVTMFLNTKVIDVLVEHTIKYLSTVHMNCTPNNGDRAPNNESHSIVESV